MAFSDQRERQRNGEPDLGTLRRHAVISCPIGNLFELYDFGVYAFFAAQIGRATFPSADPIALLLGSFAICGVGFFMRPVGAVPIGGYGDRNGRKPALVLTITLMAVATGCTGLVPSHASVGVLAPILLVLCRLLQGFSTGGERGGAASFMVEYAPAGRRGLFGSLQQISTRLGQLLSISVALVLNAVLDPHALGAWAWRLPFLLGFVLAPVGHYLGSRVAESSVFEDRRAATSVAAPVRLALTAFARSVFTAFGVTVIWTVASYVFLNYIPTYAATQLHLVPALALASTSLAALMNIVCLPPAGLTSDRVGRKPLLLVVTQRSFFALLVAQCIAAFFYALINGTASAMLCELFPTEVRYSALSIGYNGAVMIFGGFAPFIATWLIRATGASIAPSYYVTACALVSFVVVLGMRERAHLPLR